MVVGDYQGTGQFGGYYVQEEDADVDTDPDTSEGVFVFNTATAVGVGRRASASSAAPVEFCGQTQVDNVTAHAVCGSGASVTPRR